MIPSLGGRIRARIATADFGACLLDCNYSAIVSIDSDLETVESSETLVI
jgi:hypothetical protein